MTVDVAIAVGEERVRRPEAGECLHVATRDPADPKALALQRELGRCLPCSVGPLEYAATRDRIWGVVTWAPSGLGDLLREHGAPPRLAWLHQSGVGMEEIVALPIDPGVLVTSIKGADYYATPLAELVVARMLEWTKELPRFWKAQAERSWRQFDPLTLAGKTVFIFGAGAIGGAVARRLAPFDARIVIVRRQGATRAENFETLDLASARARLGDADYIVLAMPLTSGTRLCIGALDIARMKQGVFIVNVGRAALVDEAALERALRDGRIGGVALDVFWREPLRPDDPVWNWPRTAISPHMSANRRGGNAELIAGAAIETLANILAGAPLRNRVSLAAGY